MPKIPKDIRFKPSKFVQKLWLNTRKSEKIYSGVRLPGFYNTSGLPIDFVLFIIMLVLEMLGVYNLMLVGDFALIMASGLIVLDVVLAFVAHVNHRKKLLNINYSIASDDTREQQKYKQEANGVLKYISFIGKVGIVALALFKIAAFQGLLGYFNGLSLLIIATYLIVAYIHLYHTGYLVFEGITTLFFNREKSKFIKGDENYGVSEEAPFTHEIKTIKKLKEFSVNDRRFYLLDEENDGLNHYKLESYGIFDDEDVSLFVGHQKNENRAEMAIECLKFQLSIYGQAN